MNDNGNSVIFVVAIVDAHGLFVGANCFRRGDDCKACAPYAIDPHRQTTVPCVNPETHAIEQLIMWQAQPGGDHAYGIYERDAETHDEARALVSTYLADLRRR
jgi:hypothetical protein